MNQLYGKGAQSFLEGSIAWLSDNIKVNLITSGYTPSINADQFLSVIGGGNIVATSANLASKTATLGTANAANITFPAVTGSAVTYVGVYKDTGVAGTSPLILLIDTATNLPLTPNSGDITVQWDVGANKIFTLFEGLKEKDQFRLLDWLKGVMGIAAERDKSGLWIPSPTLVQA